MDAIFQREIIISILSTCATSVSKINDRDQLIIQQYFILNEAYSFLSIKWNKNIYLITYPMLFVNLYVQNVNISWLTSTITPIIYSFTTAIRFVTFRNTEHTRCCNLGVRWQAMSTWLKTDLEIMPLGKFL